jgi:nucleoside-diphosphate-sugar epimerase
MNIDLHRFFGGRRVLVLGAAGFIGRHLLCQLSRHGANVIASVRPRADGRTHGDRIGAAELPGICLVEADVRDHRRLMDLVGGTEVIYALAGRSGATRSNDEPQSDLEVNGCGLLNLLEACRAGNRSARIIFPSSRLVYGKPECIPVAENHPTVPRSVYGLHKLLGEQYLTLYHQLYGLPTVALRITNPYGFEDQPSLFTHGVINQFFRQAWRNERLQVFGDGGQLRDYAHIDDITRALLMVAATPAAAGRIYNLGTGKGLALGAVAEAIVRLVGRGQVHRVPWPAEHFLIETGDFVADIARITTEIGWQPQVGWLDGLAQLQRDWVAATVKDDRSGADSAHLV